jgi:uncharacterized protein DUF4031
MLGGHVTVYVYRLRGMWPLPGAYTYAVPWFGLSADTEEELHPLADAIGLYRHFYHPRDAAGPREPAGVGHYDVDQGERDRAVAGGARPISWRRREKILRKQAAAAAEAP